MHPRLAAGITTILYIIIGCILQNIFKKINILDNPLFTIIGVVLGFIVYMFFANRYDGDSSV